MEKLRSRSQAGFTLIELLVVIAIIGILAAIAIPQFAAYRRRGYDADVKSNIRNAATAEEAYFVDNDIYSTGVTTLAGFNRSANVGLTAGASATTFLITGTVITGCSSGGQWWISSNTGSIGGTSCN